MKPTSRRDMLRNTLAGAGGALVIARTLNGAEAAGGQAAATPTAEGSAGAGQAAANQAGDAAQQAAAGLPQLSAYAFGANVWVRIDNRVCTCYRANVDQKYPYLYPFAGPATGLSMTDETCEPWPHHRSVFFGCDRVNGANYWQEGNERGQIVSRGPKLASVKEQKAPTDAGEVVITDVCDWRVPGQSPVLEDQRRLVITAPTWGLRLLDVDITVTAKVDIHITKTNHSLFGIRAARELAPVAGGKLINSNGQVGEKATLGLPARWCGYEGRRFGITESIVVMDHPKNPWSPDCPWFTRDYGNISPTPFLWLDEKGWDLPQGKSIRLRYRVAAATGEIDKSRTDRLWEEFAAG